MKLLIVDAKGGGLGRELVSLIRQQRPQDYIIAVGTNTEATNAMRKAGAHEAATGENPVIVSCRHADVIIGALGIVIADSMTGEVTPPMAKAIAQSSAIRILIPTNRCDNIIVGVADISMTAMLQQVVDRLDDMDPQK